MNTDYTDVAGLVPGTTPAEHRLLDQLDCMEASLRDVVALLNDRKIVMEPALFGQVQDDLEMAYRTLSESGFNAKHYPELHGPAPGGLETWLMTDQPPTCPKCGRRVVILEGAETNKQVGQCPGCRFKYRLEEDDEIEEG